MQKGGAGNCLILGSDEYWKGKREFVLPGLVLPVVNAVPAAAPWRKHQNVCGRKLPVNALISLRVRKTAGAVNHLASALADFGLIYKSHEVYGSAADQCRIDIQAQGTVPRLDEVSSGLRTCDDVIEILDVRTTVDTIVGGKVDDLLASYDGHDDTAVNEIVWAYPIIGSLVAHYEERLPPNEWVHCMTKLGVQVGKRLGAGHAQLTKAHTVDTAIKEAILPALKGVATGEVRGSGLRIVASVFVRQNLDMMYLAVDEPRGCCFLSGLIQGMLSEAPYLPRLWVTETECRESGDAHCYFRVERV